MIKRKNIYLTIISISISIVLIEVFLRIIGFNKYEFTGYPPNYLIEDKALGFDINKNTKKMDFIFKDTQYKIWGNEITIAGNLTNNLSLNASYTYTNHKDTNGQELTRRAQHIASTNIQHSLLDERARLFVNIHFNGSQADNDFDAAFNRSRVKLDAFTNITLGGAYKIYDGMIVKARIENLLDDQYEEVFGFQSQGLGIYLGIGSEF